MERNDGTRLFFPWAHHFSAPKLDLKKIERRRGWMEITHLPFPLFPKTKFHIKFFFFFFLVYCARRLATYFILFFFFSLLVELIEIHK